MKTKQKVTKAKKATNTQISLRLDNDLKKQADQILEQLGLSTSDFVRMSLHQIVLRRGLPFEVKIPNAETIAAMEELKSPAYRANTKKYTSVAELLADLDNES